MPRDIIPDQRWYVAQTEPKKEKRAEQELAQQGFIAWVPKIQVWRPVTRTTLRQAKAAEPDQTPLFIGYILIEMDIHSCPWRSVNGTRGVRSLIMQGEKPLPVRRGMVEALRERLAPTNGVLIVNTPAQTHSFRPGMRLLVNKGPAFGLRGLCTDSASGRLKVLFDGMGRTTWVKADLVCAE